MKNKKNIYTVIDANINRSKEGLRVIEDLSRFVYSNKRSTAKLKAIRHGIDLNLKKISPDYTKLLKNRFSDEDVGRLSRNKTEFTRLSVEHILISNFKRVEESFRVLEEVIKLLNPRVAASFKELRYETYELEKEILA
jgi:thiamine-phosphate pyrophosphorylase